MRLLDNIKNIFKIEELRNRVLFTLGLLLVFRLGAHIPAPGIPPGALAKIMDFDDSSLFGLYDLFTGGAFKQMTIFALGIMPYISVSIIMQLLGVVVPYFQRLQKEGEIGRKKINQLTRYGTVLLGLSVSTGTAVALAGQIREFVPNFQTGFGYYIPVVLTLMTGIIFLMWLGEQITERGIGNGISLIITVGILSRLPNVIIQEIGWVQEGARQLFPRIIVIAIFVVIVGAVVRMTQGVRKIPVQYAKRIVGRKVYGGGSTHIPLRVNSAGVMPIIFAQTIMMVISAPMNMFPDNGFFQAMAGWFSPNSIVYWLTSAAVIVFFTYFWTAIMLDPVQVADNLKQNGGYVPGVRPGKKTAEYIDHILTRVTLPGSLFLAFVAMIPFLIVWVFQGEIDYSLANFMGGTSLLIMVGVALDTLQQVEQHLLTHHYDGFMKSGQIKGRKGRM